MAIPLLVAGLSAATAFYQTGQGIVDKAKARKLAKGYSRQKLTNAYENVGISTAKEEFMAENLQRREATQVDALAKLGSRGAAMVGGVAQQTQGAEREIAISMDEKRKELDRMIAADEVNIRNIQEGRDQANIAGIGQLGQTGRQDTIGGLSNIAQSAGQFARLFPDAGGGVQPANATVPVTNNQYNTNSIFDQGTQKFG